MIFFYQIVDSFVNKPDEQTVKFFGHGELNQRLILLTWFKFNPGINKESHAH